MKTVEVDISVCIISIEESDETKFDTVKEAVHRCCEPPWFVYIALGNLIPSDALNFRRTSGRSNAQNIQRNF